ncbi:MAG: hemerythrin domain-containing protein [Gemmatimonadota bacterium]|nr:hemerythrin domain-containing protein [Gemmatimonadota bacterium]
MTDATAETPTSRLRDEHVVILAVADALEALVTEAEAGRWNFGAFGDALTFIRLFADACHHGKEEDLLFPELEKTGLPRDRGPIAVMLEEHRQGREFARHMAGALASAREGDERARATLRNAAAGYVNLIRGHIAKEDHVLFHMADQAVRGTACRTLCGAYAGVCGRHFEGHTKEQLTALATSIRERAGLTA